MTFILKIKHFFHHTIRSIKNRKFRKTIEKERKKKYLFSGTVAKRSEKGIIEYAREVLRSRKNFRFPTFFLNVVREEQEKIKTGLAGVGILLMVLSGYITLGSSYFQLSPNKVIIERLDAGSDINIAYKSIEWLYGQSIFFISENDVRSSITGLQKNISDIQFSRLYPRGMKLILSSYPPVFLTYFPLIEKYYSITSNGILIYERSSKTLKLPMLDIIDPTLSESEFLDYKQGVSPDKMKKILFVMSKIKEFFPSLNVAKISYFRLEQEIHISFESGGRAIISLDGTENNQLATLKYWNTEEKNILESGGFSYIDVRIAGRVFVCKDENVCRANLARVYGVHYKK